MRYFVLLLYAFPVLLIVGSILLFRHCRTVATFLMVLGSAVGTVVLALPFAEAVPVLSDCFGRSRLSADIMLWDELLAIGSFSVGFFCYARTQTHSTYQSGAAKAG